MYLCNGYRPQIDYMYLDKVNCHIISLWYLPDMVKCYYLACNPAPLLLKLAIIEDGYLLPSVNYASVFWTC